jgi:hypothetical protein
MLIVSSKSNSSLTNEAISTKVVDLERMESNTSGALDQLLNIDRPLSIIQYSICTHSIFDAEFFHFIQYGRPTPIEYLVPPVIIYEYSFNPSIQHNAGNLVSTLGGTSLATRHSRGPWSINDPQCCGLGRSRPEERPGYSC